MRLAVDSSSLAKRYIHEAGSEQLAELLRQATELGLCVIVVPEILSALNRRVREGILCQRDYRQVKTQLLMDVRDVTILQITPAVAARTVGLLEKNTLRAMDALHLACALEWQADLFLSSDKRQVQAAGKSGLPTKYIG
jgi:predicted nucleic acid-binding protein